MCPCRRLGFFFSLECARKELFASIGLFILQACRKVCCVHATLVLCTQVSKTALSHVSCVALSNCYAKNLNDLHNFHFLSVIKSQTAKPRIVMLFSVERTVVGRYKLIRGCLQNRCWRHSVVVHFRLFITCGWK